MLGAIVGGALGNQVGKGDGRAAATVGGAVVGGAIGHNIAKNSRPGNYVPAGQLPSGRRRSGNERSPRRWLRCRIQLQGRRLCCAHAVRPWRPHPRPGIGGAGR